MERITYRITLDAYKNGIQRTLQGFETGDNVSRRLAINLVSGGDTFEIAQDVIAMIYVHNGSATPSINACEIVDNTIIYDVLPITEEGIFEMQVKLIEVGINGAQKVLVAPKIAVEVTESGTEDGGATGTTTFTALENALAKAEAVYNSRIIGVEIGDDCTFKVMYADGTVYENDYLKEALYNGNALLSESFAHGNTGIREGENTDNAKYYSNVSKSASEEAKIVSEEARDLLEESRLLTTFTDFKVNFETGELTYMSANYDFEVNEKTGDLEVDTENGYEPEQVIKDSLMEIVEEKIDYVTPQMYGAVADGVTDDTEAIQKAINSGFPVVFPYGKNVIYRISSVVTIDKNSARYIGAEKLSLNDTCIMLDKNAYFHVKTEQVTIENLRFCYNGDVNNRGEKAIYCHRDDELLDMDVSIINCCFSWFDYCVVSHGRGLLVKECLFSFSNRAIYISYVGTDTNVGTTDDVGGGRAHVIRNSRFHGMLTSAVYIEANSKLTGVIADNNLLDIGNGFLEVYGELYGGRITNNNFMYSNTAPIKLYSKTTDLVIDGNLFYNNNVEMNKNYPSNLIYCDKDCAGQIDGLIVTDNVFSGVINSAIAFNQSTPIENCIIKSNVFKDMKTQDNIMHAPLYFGAGAIDCIISDNIFASVGDGMYCVRSAASGITVTGNIILGNKKKNANAVLLFSPFTNENNVYQEY